jgi:hypothetical protein
MALSSHYEMGRDLTLWEKHAGVGCPGELYSSWLVAGGWWLVAVDVDVDVDVDGQNALSVNIGRVS